MVIMVMLPAAVAFGGRGESGQGSRSFYMGFTPFPPDMTVEAVIETDDFIGENRDIIAHHLDGGVPWTEALDGKAFHENLQNDWDRRKAMSIGKKTLVSVTPLNGGRSGMARYRGSDENMSLPAKFAGKAFDDPVIKTAYLNYCRRAVQHFEPDYLAIGIEVNELIHHSGDKWAGFVELYRHTYSELKKTHPDLPIFATITLHNLTNKGWKDLAVQQEKIREFLPSLDIVGVSYYPFMAGQSERPTATLDWLRSFTDQPIAITETGFPAEKIVLKTFNVTIPADAAKQQVYYETILGQAVRDDYVFVISFLHRDYDAMWEKIKGYAPEAFIVWKDCGLLDETGKGRPARETWQRYFAKKHTPKQRP